MLKDFLMTLAATTVSIILTFGTSAVIDRNKKDAAKREMVMMIMYDMKEAISDIEECDKNVKEFFDIQVDIVAHPEKFDDGYYGLLASIPIFEYPTTTENIFKSNIETVNTIGNILFVETVTMFYDTRARYKTDVVDAFLQQGEKAIQEYESLSDFNTPFFSFLSQNYYMLLRRYFEQCKLMMKVSDEDLEVFSKEREILEAEDGESSAQITERNLDDRQQMTLRLQQAIMEGKKALE